MFLAANHRKLDTYNGLLSQVTGSPEVGRAPGWSVMLSFMQLFITLAFHATGFVLMLVPMVIRKLLVIYEVCCLVLPWIPRKI